MRTREHGFTLIELMIVVAVIAVITAMAIPIITNARVGANEGSAVSAMRSLVTANQTYETRFNSYASNLSDLESIGAIDSVLSAASALPGKSGYLFVYTGTRNTFEVSASPITVGSTGIRYFYADHTGVIRFAEGGVAVSTDPPIDG